MQAGGHPHGSRGDHTAGSSRSTHRESWVRDRRESREARALPAASDIFTLFGLACPPDSRFDRDEGGAMAESTFRFSIPSIDG